MDDCCDDDFMFKHFDVLSNLSVSNVGSISLLNAISLGPGDTQRVGRTISMEDLELRYILDNTATDDVVRTIIFIDKQTNGALPAVSDVLEYVDAISPYNGDNSKRFEILYDEATVLSAKSFTNAFYSENILLASRAVYNANAFADARDIQTGSLCLLVIGVNAVNFTSYSIRTRLWYADL